MEQEENDCGMEFARGRGALAPITHKFHKFNLRKRKTNGASAASFTKQISFPFVLLNSAFALPRAIRPWCAVCSSSLRSINQLSFHKRLIDCRKEELHSLSFWSSLTHSFISSLFSLFGGAIGAAAPITHHKRKEEMNFMVRSSAAAPLKSFHSIQLFIFRFRPPKQLNHQTNHSSHSQREE